VSNAPPGEHFLHARFGRIMDIERLFAYSEDRRVNTMNVIHA